MSINRFNFRAYIKEYNKIYRVYNLMENGDIVECIDDNGNFVGDGFYKNDFVLMQSTGLVDKNGKEIYEGDILTDSSIKYLVRFEEEKAWFVMKPILCGKTLLTYYEELGKRYMHYYEIIGNIYENSELLEEFRKKLKEEYARNNNKN